MTLAELERTYPGISWREPLPIAVTNGDRCLGCRVCIAAHGFQARAAKDWPQTRVEFDEHFAEHL